MLDWTEFLCKRSWWSWWTDMVLLCLVQLHNYTGCFCWNVSVASLLYGTALSFLSALPHELNLFHLNFSFLISRSLVLPSGLSFPHWSCVTLLISCPLVLSFLPQANIFWLRQSWGAGIHWYIVLEDNRSNTEGVYHTGRYFVLDDKCCSLKSFI